MVGSAILLVALTAPADFDSIVLGVGDRSADASCSAMMTWAADNPSDPRGRRGKVWCARLLLVPDRRRSEEVLQQLVAERADDEAAMQAFATLSAIHYEGGRYVEAEAESRLLITSPVALWRDTGARTLLEAQRARRLSWQAWGVAALLCGGLIRRAASLRRALWPPPAEVGVLAPLLILLAIVAATLWGPAGWALLGLAAGGAAIAWINGAYWRGHPPSSSAWPLEALIGGAQGLLLLDCVLVGSGLWRSLWQSLTGGFS